MTKKDFDTRYTITLGGWQYFRVLGPADATYVERVDSHAEMRVLKWYTPKGTVTAEYVASCDADFPLTTYLDFARCL